MQEKVRIVAIVALTTTAIFSATLAINLTIQSAHANGIIQFGECVSVCIPCCGSSSQSQSSLQWQHNSWSTIGVITNSNQVCAD